MSDRRTSGRAATACERARVGTGERSRVPTALALVLTVSPLAAQTPGERAVLDSMRASFAAVSDSASLVVRERERIAVARVERDDPLIHMELGFLSYRLGELTGVRSRYGDAASEFQWAADLRPGWAYAWYNLGLAELASGEHEVILLENIRQVLGTDFLSRAARAFARAAEADPSFARALVELTTTAMRQRIAPRLAVAQSALRLAAGTAAGRDPEVLLVRGRLERRLGAHDSSLAVFRRYADAGGDRGVGATEAARSLALLGRRDSALATFDSALAAPTTDSSRGGLRGDLRWVATPAELQRFDALPPESVGAWVRLFWRGRDVAAGRRAGERLLEHFRRHQYAVENFGLVSRRRAMDPSFAYRDPEQGDVDDRGVVYIRHGPPDERARFDAPRVEPNESWLYRRPPPEQDMVFHFVARGEVQDYRLVESLVDVLGSGPGAQLSAAALGTGPMSLLGMLYGSRSEFGPVYQRLQAGASGASPLLAEEREAGRRSVRAGTTTDSYPLRFESDLRPLISWFAVADQGLRPELHVIFALPGRRLHPVAAESGVMYLLGLRLVVADEAFREVAAVDTVRVFRSRGELGEGSFLTEQLVVPVPPGRWRTTFVVRELRRDAGAAVSGVEVEVPRLDGGFSASDLVLGRDGSGLVWRRAEGDVLLNPLMRYPRDGVAELYYELYGLPLGATVETRVRVSRRGGRSIFARIFGRGGGAQFDYETVTDASGRARVRQRLVLEGLSPGQYTLVVDLVDRAGGRRISRSAPFEIENRPAP